MDQQNGSTKWNDKWETTGTINGTTQWNNNGDQNMGQQLEHGLMIMDQMEHW